MSLLLFLSAEDAQIISLPTVFATTTGVLLDENGMAILDESGGLILIGDVGVFSPGVMQNVTVVLPLVTSPQTIFELTVTAPAQVTVTLPLVTTTQTIFEPTITQIGTSTVELPLVTTTQTVFAPSVSITGTQTVVLPFVVETQTVFTPAVLPTTIIELPLVTSTQTIFAPTVIFLVGPFTLIPPHDENGPRKLSEYGRRRAGVSKMANDLAGRYGAPQSYSILKINGVYQVIQGPTMEQVNAATEYYAGGHEHEVTEAQAAALHAAGFEVLRYP